MLSFKHILSYIKQLLMSLKVCQNNAVVHRDLKPANLFITRRNVLKLGDFGLARKIATDRSDPNVYYTSNVITLYYRPPELLMHCTRYGHEVDIWSVGCIIYEMMTRRALFKSSGYSKDEDKKNIEQLQAIFSICGTPDKTEWPEFFSYKGSEMFSSVLPNRLREHLEATIPEEYAESVDLLMRMLQLNPEKRISAEEAVMDPWIAKFRDELEPSRLNPIEFGELHQMEVSAQRHKEQARDKEKSLAVEKVKPTNI